MKVIHKYGLKPINKMASKKRKKIVAHVDKGYVVSDKLLYEDNETVPDQSLKIRDVIDRFTRGLPVNVETKRGVFPDQVSHDSPDIEALGRMDRMDKFDFARSAQVKRKKEVPKPEKVDPPKPAEPAA